jgi:hypothetical protein
MKLPGDRSLDHVEVRGKTLEVLYSDTLANE